MLINKALRVEKFWWRGPEVHEKAVSWVKTLALR